MDVFNNIRARRLELGISQSDLAVALGYKSRSSIAKIESGATDIPLSKLHEIADALDVSVADLVSGFPRTVQGKTGLPRVGQEGERRVAAVVLAGGRSSRNLQSVPNQYVSVLGKPLIVYCLEAYQRHPLVDDIFIVCSESWESVVETFAARFGIAKMRGTVRAGSTGVRSIANGLRRLLAEGYRDGDLVVLQEATRPFVTEEMVSAVLVAGSRDGSAIIGERMGDSVQFLVDGSETSYIARDSVISLQSPDAYTIDFLQEVFRKAEQQDVDLSYSCMGLMMDALGYSLNFCDNAQGNMKIVRQEDIAVFTALVKQRL